MLRNKITDKITKVSEYLPKNNSGTVRKETEKITKKRNTEREIFLKKGKKLLMTK